MTQVVIKKEKPCVLTEEFFEAGMFVKDFNDDILITSLNLDNEEMMLISLTTGERSRFRDDTYYQCEIIDKGTVLEITV